MGQLDAVDSVAPSIASGEASEVEPGRSLDRCRSLQPTAAGRTGHRRALPVTDGPGAVTIGVGGVDHRRTASVWGHENGGDSPTLARRLLNHSHEIGGAQGPARLRSGREGGEAGVRPWARQVGEPGGDRTLDTRIKSPVLYH